MHDANQAPPPVPVPIAPTGPAAEPAVPQGSSDFHRFSPELPPDRSEERGLTIWLAIVASAFVVSAVFQQAELGLLTALGGMFAVAHAVDRNERWTLLHNFLAWIPPVGGALMFAGIAWYLKTVDLGPSARMTGIASSLIAAAITLVMALRPVTDGFARVLFRTPTPGHSDRLAARLVVMGFLLLVPAWVAMASLADSGLDSLSLGTGSFVGSVVGFTLLSLGAVGFAITRGVRETIDRLGLRRFGGRDVLVAGLGLFAILALNVAMEWFAMRFAPGSWARDQAMNQMIAGRLTRTETLLLGVSAGIGEELAMRGALQPRFGLVGTSLLFAVLHVQYSAVGILTIAALGMILGAIRSRTSTTTAIAVHVLYDIVAAFGIQDQFGR